MSEAVNPEADSPTAPPSVGTAIAPRRISSRLRTVAGIASIAVYFWHGCETLGRFPLGRPGDKLPFTQYDHPFHYYYSQLTREFFASRRAFWGYDPTFMAGYAKTLIFPTSSTLPELAALAAGPNPAFAYRLFVISTVLLTPAVLALAARSLTDSWNTFAVALYMAVLWFWIGWPSQYVIWGMGSFILASALSVYGGVLLARWLDEPSHRSLLVGSLAAAAASIVHPSSPVILAVLLAPAYVARFGSLSWRRHLVCWTTPLIVIVAWAPWWVPAVVLRETLGTTASGFVNENVLGRMEELANAEFSAESALIVAALAACTGLCRAGRVRSWSLIVTSALFLLTTLGAVYGLWTVRLTDSWLAQLIHVPFSLADRVGGPWLPYLLLAAIAMGVAVALCRSAPAAVWGMAGGAVGLFAIAYFASAFRWAWALQPGRYTQSLYALLIVLTAAGVSRLVGSLLVSLDVISRRASLAALTVCSASILLVLPESYDYLKIGRGPFLTATLPATVHRLADYLRRHTDGTGRILFEDRGRLSLGRNDPFLGTNPSALLPHLAPGHYIGGPYLYTHLKTNFTQVGDGYFFSRNLRKVPIDLATFQCYADLYNIRWAVLWSLPLTKLALENPDYFEPRGRLSHLHVFELAREPNWAVTGSARVVAGPDRLEVSGARPDSTGKLVLSYHWISTLHASIPLHPVFLHDDPVPFIAVDNPPDRFVIKNGRRN